MEGIHVVLNVDEYITEPMPEGLASATSQYLLRDPNTGEARYTAYVTAPQVMSEIVYTRLAAILGLPCVKSYLGYGLQTENSPEWVSVSEYNEQWEPYHEWLTAHKTFSNPEDPDRFELLNCLTYHPNWDNRHAGYITEGEQFIKANNGSAFFSLGLGMKLRGRKEYRNFLYCAEPSYVLQTVHYRPELLEFIPRIAQLTQYDIETCVDFPDNPSFNDGRGYFVEAIEHARNVVQEALKIMAKAKENPLEAKLPAEKE